MKQTKKTIIHSFWFLLEVIGILITVQAIRYAFGNWDAPAIGLFLLGIASLLFSAAYLFARMRDKRNRNNPSGKTITNILS